MQSSPNSKAHNLTTTIGIHISKIVHIKKYQILINAQIAHYTGVYQVEEYEVHYCLVLFSVTNAHFKSQYLYLIQKSESR